MRRNQKAVSLFEHVRGFSTVNLDASSATGFLAKYLHQYGCVEQQRFSSLDLALGYIIPLKSFATRFLILGLNGMSVIVSDMKSDNAYVDAYAICRLANCDGIGVFSQSERRELFVCKRGKKVRQVQSLQDGDKWYFREEGPLQIFEDAQEYRRKRKRERLSIKALAMYYQSFTGFAMPDWKNQMFSEMFGLERSTKELKVPLVRFETMHDV